MKIKIISLLLVLIMLAGAFTACGGDPAPTPDEGDTPGSDTPEGDTPPAGGDNDGGDEEAPEVDELPVYDWEETSLIFQLSDNSNQQQRPSACKRYLAGEDTGNFETIDEMVTERNADALAYSCTNIVYEYIPDTIEYSWGKNIENIFTVVNSQSKDRPDMFVNFCFDMISASLKGALANLWSTERGTGPLYGANYFTFTDIKTGNYVDTGVGYMYQYMRSLTLSKHKMYCVASDYFIDLVRAFMAVPVNLELLNSIEVAPGGAQGLYNSDRDGDGDFDVDDFYQLIRDKDWNYETLADFCTAIYADESENVGSTELADLSDRIGFAISSSSGLPAVGLLYTTPITIIHRDWNDDRNDYSYYYPEENPMLYDFCEKLATLFSTTGVISLSNSETLGFGVNAYDAVRNRFAQNKVLFGGVIVLGSLEYEAYQEMKNGAGFGVAPVPLYRSVNPETGEADDYLTQIDSSGMIGGISASTTKFAQCTAFLEYMSQNSTDILNEYYDYKLQYDVADGTSGNIEILQYIRANVRSAFDMVYEDVLGRFFGTVDPDSASYRWHAMLMANGFRVTTMETEYSRLYETKELYLQSLVKEYDILPN